MILLFPFRGERRLSLPRIDDRDLTRQCESVVATQTANPFTERENLEKMPRAKQAGKHTELGPFPPFFPIQSVSPACQNEPRNNHSWLVD